MEDLRHVCISTGLSGTGFVWNLDTGDIILQFKKNKNDPNCVAFINDPPILIAAQKDKPAIQIYDLKRENPTFTCYLSEKITSLCTTPDGIYCFGGGESGSVYVWQVATGLLIKIFQAHIKAVTAMACTPDSSYLITGSSDTLVNVYNIADVLDIKRKNERKISPLYTCSSHALQITSIKCTTSGVMKFITSSLDRTCKIWDLSSGIEICSILYPSQVLAVVIDPSEHMLYAGCADGKIYETNMYAFSPKYLEAHSGTKNLTVEYTGKDYTSSIFSGHTNSITDLNLSMDGCTLASASKDGSVIVWDTQSKQILHSFKKRIGATDVEITNIQVLYISKKHFETSDFDDKTIRLSIQPFSKFAVGDDVERDKNVAIKMTMNMKDDDVMDILEDEIFDSCLVENISSVDPFKKKNFDPILIKVQNAYLETLKTNFESRKKKK